MTNDKGEKLWSVTITRKVVISMVASVLLIVSLCVVGIVTTNRRAVDSQEETQLLGKCVFNFLAYRALVTEGRQGQLPTEVPPYADLTLPENPKTITLVRCQKYLQRIAE